MNESNGRALLCRGLSKSFRKREKGKRTELRALVGVDLEVARGGIFGVIGPNGSGKSTLVRLLSTLLLPDEGEMRIFGYDVVADAPRVKRLINRVSVDAAFFKKLSPWENLSYAARLYGGGGKGSKDEAKRILELLDFPAAKFYAPMQELSRGQQQKVAIARALLTSPVLLLLDEPTTGLDPKSKLQVQAFIRRLRREHDATVLLTSHDMEEVERVCDEIAIMDGGEILESDTATGLKHRHRVNGKLPSLEEVFIRVTGHGWEPEVEEARALANKQTDEKAEGGG
ncbi:MAG TPA: ABC transporter ATP-binding protein [Candidatus Coatesbacteria bacterium]|nr:ABC transporter ATP-binding protein [Candidatus Coatesbacteria bacterium]